MSSQNKKVTYKHPIDENTDYLVPLQYEYRSSLPASSAYVDTVSASPPPSTGGLFGSIYFPVSLLLYVAIPISQLVIGLIYIGQCPVQPIIVTWMIVSGVFGILLVAAGLVIHTQIRKQSTYASRLAVRLLLPFFAFVLLFVIVWFFAGQVFVFQVKLRVEFFDSALPEYCHGNLYKAAYILIFIDYLLFLLAIILNVLSFVAPPEESARGTRPTKRPSIDQRRT